MMRCFLLEETMDKTQKPLIGITAGTIKNRSAIPVCQVGQAYVDAVRRAGGIPAIIPTGIKLTDLTELVSRFDGFILSGGADIDPERYHSQPHPKIFGVSLQRDAFEFGLLMAILEEDKPLLGICRGFQVLNVGLGGTLYTHIDDQLEGAIKHDWFPDYPRDRRSHNIQMAQDSFLERLLETDQISVNSLHHQGIDVPGKGLEAIGFAPDGLIEAAIVKDARFALGLQWHPECLPDDPHSQTLFHAFVQACID